jgi:ubiquinone/menaquinone biosynthesis C-methylase UbiE
LHGGVLGADLAELLGERIPADHSHKVLADDYARRYMADPGRPPSPRVLDLGCGAGDSVGLFRSLEPRVRWTGVDIERSPEVAERTRTDAEFVTFDGVRLPFGDDSFDLVYCKQVLEHVRHPEPLLAEVARVLAPGGSFAGSTSHLEAFHSLSLWNYTPYGLATLIEDAGLQVIEVRPVIDAFTLVGWRALGTPRFFYRWWARESPPYRAISLLARPARWDHRTVNTAKLVLSGQFAFLARLTPRSTPRTPRA